MRKRVLVLTSGSWRVANQFVEALVKNGVILTTAYSLDVAVQNLRQAEASLDFVFVEQGVDVLWVELGVVCRNFAPKAKFRVIVLDGGHLFRVHEVVNGKLDAGSSYSAGGLANYVVGD